MAPSRYDLTANELATMLSGSTLPIPNLKQHLANFPRGVNKYVTEIRQWVDQLIDENVQNREKCSGIKRCDFGFLASCCFPDSDWDELKTAAAFLVWIFTWDDIIDHGEGDSDITSSEELAQIFCKRSLDHAKYKLNLDVSYQSEASGHSLPSMTMFNQVAGPVAAKWNKDQTQRFYNEMEFYVNCCLVEHMQQQDDSIPTQEDYTNMRFGTSGIAPGIALCEFTRSVTLPNEIVESAPMKVVWREITRLCMMINDIYSCPKELRSGVIQNIIPVIAYASETDDINTVTREFMDIFQKSIKTFEESFLVLRALASPDPKLAEDLEKYLQNCQTITTGLLEWMLSSERYGIKKHIQADGSALVPLLFEGANSQKPVAAEVQVEGVRSC
ncbi:isoprenoid synthase domain-containing protein [Trichoderma ceciliae]